MIVLILLIFVFFYVGIRIFGPLFSAIEDKQRFAKIARDRRNDEEYSLQAKQYISQFHEQLTYEAKYIATMKKFELYKSRIDEMKVAGKEVRRASNEYIMYDIERRKLENDTFEHTFITPTRKSQIEKEAVWMAENYVRNLPLRSREISSLVPLHLTKNDYAYKEDMKKYFPNKI